MNTPEDYLDQAITLVIQYGGKVLLAIVTLIVGMWVIKRITRLFGNSLEKRNIDPSLIPFLRSLTHTLLKALLVVSVASMAGFEMTSFIAILGAAGLAVGLALQGSLSNFAGGVLILLLKPFKVGDFIEGAGTAGTVREIQIFYTYLTTPSGQEIIIPNGNLSNNSITNFSYNSTRRIDLTYGIGYDDDIDQAKQVLHQLCAEEGRFLDDKGITIFVEALADSSVNIHVRGWSKNEDYWNIIGDLNEKVKKAFDAANVGIPFPQMDFHLVEDKTK